MHESLLFPAFLVSLLAISAAQIGEFPSPVTVALNKPVTSTASCGMNAADTYCRYTTNSAESLAPNCLSAVCNNTCPFSSSSPSSVNLAVGATLGTGVTTDTGRPGSSSLAYQLTNSFLSTTVGPVSTEGFSFAVWIKQNLGNSGAVLSRPNGDGSVRHYSLLVSESTITFEYFSSASSSVLISNVDLSTNFWHHIAVTVYREDLAVYVNGSVVRAVGLQGPVLDEQGLTTYLGQTSPGVGFYQGIVQDPLFYNQSLTQREVVEVATGTFPGVHLSSECRCPPSHPVAEGSLCVQHVGTSISRGAANRINSLAHPPGYINDNSFPNNWISAIGERQVNISIDFTAGSDLIYDLIFVFIRFGSPPPRAAVLEKSVDRGMTFTPMQYFADDCMQYFNLPNDQPLTAPDGVNCITQYSTQIPTRGTTARVRLLDPEVRPGDLNSDAELRSFILATNIQLRLLDYFNETTTSQHLYYSIDELSAAGRCSCNGHASQCSSDRCHCVHNTQGVRCESCLPLYNDKPWREGNTFEAFPCKLCNCNNHSSSCTYNSSLDSNPNDHNLGGGGVCNDCQDNTGGQHCDTCVFGFFRPGGVLVTDPNPCSSCECDTAGSVTADCVKNEGIADQIAGQCSCKMNVRGLKCDECNEGFFDLRADRPEGCQACNCNTAGTVAGSITCNQATGQCNCKTNVEGLKCDRCRNGTSTLSTSNPDGCSLCTCNAIGSLTETCNINTGLCECKPGVGGTTCDQCLPGFFGLSDTGCQPCACFADGSDSTECNQITGACNCLPNYSGLQCNECATGRYNISDGCPTCGCDSAGTIAGQIAQCNSITGQCDCKTNVMGRICDTCRTNFTNLDLANVDGCSPCDCLANNIDSSSSILCDPVSQQCVCLPSAIGLDCSMCESGFFMSDASLCIPCECNSTGAVNNVCNATSGDCTCVNSGVMGQTCDSCRPGFYQFPSCLQCQCNAAGSVSSTICDVVSGECQCKANVEGLNCDTCKNGFQILDQNNPFGCSAAPAQQAPPTLLPESSSTVLLTWLPPESPNGIITLYRLFRGSDNIANTSGQVLNYTDTSLSPNTVYLYAVESVNIIGSAKSVELSVRTQEAPPTGVLPPTLTPVNSTAVQAMWQAPSIPNGVIQRYELRIVAINGQSLSQYIVAFTGLAFSAGAVNLQPFTTHTFVITACTMGGCTSSSGVDVQTLEDAPLFQPAPNVTSINSTAFTLTWTSPDQPNGVITGYTLFQRESPFTGNGAMVGSVSSEPLSLVVGGLQPFTPYEFRVVSATSAGSTPSAWTRETTLEDVPSGVQSPLLTVLGPTSIRVSWIQPQVPNGVILRYEVYQLPSVLLVNATTTGSHDVTGLSPNTLYQFIVTVCTAVGCTSSVPATASTSESAPMGLSAPSAMTLNSSSIRLQWTPPTQPNGDITGYFLQRRRPSIVPSRRDHGVAFYGTHFASFPPSTSLSGFSISLSLWFRTSRPSGVLVYAISESRSDMIAIELRAGVPWFIFDSGSGPGAIRPATNVTFNDGRWHTLSINLVGRDGTISVDNMYSGSGSSIGVNQFIGVASVLYVGGLADGAPLSSAQGSSNPSATLIGGSFTGCLFNVMFNAATLDFSTQLNPSSGVGLPGTGCLVDTEPGVSFIGGGYLQLSPLNISSNTIFTISLSFRTTKPTGVLLFAYGSNSHVLLEVINSSVSLRVKGSNTNEQSLLSNQQVCNGQWHQVEIYRESDGVILNVDGQAKGVAVNNLNLGALSSTFLGGVQPTAQGTFTTITGRMVDEYSGCMRALSVNNAVVDMYGSRESLELVRYGGCGNSTSNTALACSTGDSELNVGVTTSRDDSQLDPFTEYLYRVSAVNSAGRTASSWSLGITQHSNPSEVGQVLVTGSTSTSISVSWQPPSQPNGIIVRYTVAGTPVSTVGLATPSATTVTQDLLINEPEVSLMTTLSGLQPATNYSLVLTAATNGGDTSGIPTYHLTGENVPVGVQTPLVVARTSSSLSFSWNPPIQPNGIITSYQLFIGTSSISAGTGLSASISNLTPFTNYQYFLQACTAIGCANSSVGSNITLSASPEGVAPPTLIALSPTSVRATWTIPTTPNGIITSYSLVHMFGPGLSQQETLFTGLQLEAVVSNLTANTRYYFSVVARTNGGETASTAANVTTSEDIPDCISPPQVTIINSTALRVDWGVPCEPNGVITEYRLLQNDQVIFTGLEMTYLVTGLEPFTEYSFTIMACTAKGCGASSPATQRTAEATPTEYNPPNVTDTQTNTATIVINPVNQPNGIVQYILTMTGEFLLAPTPPGGERNSTLETKVVYSSTEVGTVIISNLVPFFEYQCVLNVTNSAGSLVGDSFSLMTAPAAPEGLSPPVLSLSSATVVMATWSAPIHSNGILTRYQVAITAPSPGLVMEVAASATNAVLFLDLPPFTTHTVSVTAINSAGNITSAETTIITGETDPSDFDPIASPSVGSRQLNISWDPPARPNGVIVNYTILLDDEQEGVVDASVTSFTVSQLDPFTDYSISIETCNSIGCVENTPVNVTTAEDVPENMSAPVLTTTTDGSIVISWQPPLLPHGVIIRYRVERSMSAPDSFSQVATVSSSTLTYTDTSLTPFSVYRYRIIAENSAGQVTGPFAAIQTPEAAPAGVSPPVLMALSYSAILVTILPPAQLNGIISSYNITRAPSTTFTISFPDTTAPNVTITDSTLLPVTTYTYTVTACTSAGCTTSMEATEATLEGPPTSLLPPETETLSENSIMVSWQPPSNPNGVLLGFRLLRASIGYSSSSPTPSCCEQLQMNISLDSNCGLVAQIPASALSYTDAGLEPYSFYRYCVIVFNAAGSTYSNFSDSTQTLPAPMPADGPVTTAVAINSTAIQISWTPLDVSVLLGPLSEYTLLMEESEDQQVEIFSGTDESFTVTGLMPSTKYTFVVEVNNTRGTALGNATSATTLDGIPENLPAPSVLAINGTAIIIEWVEPIIPNGFIIIYTVLLNSVQIHNQTTVGSLVVSDLKPFTLYSAQITACTVFGCTSSPVASNRTSETTPFGLGSPSLTVLGPDNIRVTWNEPLDSNGIITRYDLHQATCEEDNPCNFSVIFSSLGFNTSAMDLDPHTSYGFRVEAVNSAGSVFSETSFQTTDEDAPSSVAAPYPASVSSSSITVTWQSPEQANGVITSYQLYRDDEEIFTGLATSFTDTGLTPFTSYNYIVEACTNGGCTNSSVVMNTTMEAVPAGFNDPIVSLVQARSLILTWSSPSMPNGVILYYTLSYGNGTVVSNSTALAATVTGLSPFTNYSFLVMACNTAGCSQTSLITQQTQEAVPEEVFPPDVRDLSTTSVEITWMEPGKPNGIITNYTIRRDGVVIFQGLAFELIDTDLVGDVLYMYTVESVNAAGGTVSSVTNIRTRVGIPEGLAPPNLTVINSTAILAVWTQPIKDNGQIFNYTLSVNQMMFFMGLQFDYTIVDLTPFTSYSVFIQACNLAGCASSTTAMAETDAALPGIPLPPTLVALDSNVVEVSWTAPAEPNGIISSYFIFRRLPGSFPLVNFQSSSPASFNSTGLSPYTVYEYRVRVVNQVGFTESEYVEVRTLEALPTNLNPPSFPQSGINANNVTAQWTPPAQPNGVITSYRLFYRIPLDPVTNSPGTPILAATVQPNITTAVVTGLSPFTSYEFRIIAVNGAGEGVSIWELVTTGEALPNGISPIIVELRTAETLVLRWDPPSMPNGVIQEYQLFLDGERVFHNSLTMYTVMRLDPFTTYTIHLSVCNSAGCTDGTPQSVTTSEAPPENQQVPTLTVITPYSLRVSWDTPLNPNGIVTQFEVLRVAGTQPPPSNLTGVLTLFSTIPTIREYNDTTVLPASGYQYAIRTTNNAGETVSPFLFILMPEAAPVGISTPSLDATGPTSIQTTWTPPTMPNGVITIYQLFRVEPDDNIVSVYTGQNPTFTDTGLSPFTLYSYFLQACTAGGCGNGSMAMQRTDETIPEGLSAPVATALSANNISITWQPPQTPNGIITEYRVTIRYSIGNQQPVIQITVTSLSTIVTNLPIYTVINMTLQACTSAGCVLSEPSYVRTLEDNPTGVQPPMVLAVGPAAVQVNWSAPLQPNGIILAFVLRRNNSVVYEGSTLSFTDTGLLPFTYYTYDVQANNSAGYSTRSNGANVQTLVDTPTNVAAPTLVPLSPTSILASWTEPTVPDGAAVMEYRLYVNNQVRHQGDSNILQQVVSSLEIFTTYQFLVEACTTTCANSSISLSTTLSDLPEGQGAPILIAQPNAVVNITWSLPASPNGIITSYTLERRQIINGLPSAISTIFSGLALSYVDQDSILVPALQYEYRVTSMNDRGNSVSDFTGVVLLEEVPEGVPGPQLVNKTDTTVTLSLSPPSIPNGNLTQFRLYQNSLLIATRTPTGSAVLHTLTNQVPFSQSEYYFEVCTSAGCTAGASLVARTNEAPPANLPPPVASQVMFRSMVISWVPPINPNGNLTRYSLWFKLPCPQPVTIPALNSGSECQGSNTYQLLSQTLSTITSVTFSSTNGTTIDPTPFTNYQFLLQVENNAGAVNSSESLIVTTSPAAPEVNSTGFIRFEIQDNTAIQLDWSETFLLNGILQYYELIGTNEVGEDVSKSQGSTQSRTLFGEPRGIRLRYVVRAVSTEGQIDSTPLFLQLPDTPSPPTLPPTNGTVPSPSVTPALVPSPFYQQIPFIVGMVILALLPICIILIIIVACCRPRKKDDYKVSTLKSTTSSPDKEPGTVRGSWTRDLSVNQSQEPSEVTVEPSRPPSRPRSRPKKHHSPVKPEQMVLTNIHADTSLGDTHIARLSMYDPKPHPHKKQLSSPPSLKPSFEDPSLDYQETMFMDTKI